MAWKDVGANVAVGVITAVVLGILTVSANWASHGGLVHILGGATPDDITTQLKNTRAAPAQGPSPSLTDASRTQLLEVQTTQRKIQKTQKVCLFLATTSTNDKVRSFVSVPGDSVENICEILAQKLGSDTTWQAACVVAPGNKPGDIQILPPPGTAPISNPCDWK